jgi:hypothetical protein
MAAWVERKRWGRSGRFEPLHSSLALPQWLMGILCTVVPPATLVVPPHNTEFA